MKHLLIMAVLLSISSTLYPKNSFASEQCISFLEPEDISNFNSVDHDVVRAQADAVLQIEILLSSSLAYSIQHINKNTRLSNFLRQTPQLLKIAAFAKLGLKEIDKIKSHPDFPYMLELATEHFISRPEDYKNSPIYDPVTTDLILNNSLVAFTDVNRNDLINFITENIEAILINALLVPESLPLKASPALRTIKALGVTASYSGAVVASDLVAELITGQQYLDYTTEISLGFLAYMGQRFLLKRKTFSSRDDAWTVFYESGTYDYTLGEKVRRKQYD